MMRLLVKFSLTLSHHTTVLILLICAPHFTFGLNCYICTSVEYPMDCSTESVAQYHSAPCPNGDDVCKSILRTAPDDSRTLELGCGNRWDDFGGETNDCEQEELFDNHVEVCVCDYTNCNGKSTREMPFEGMILSMALVAAFLSPSKVFF